MTTPIPLPRLGIDLLTDETKLAAGAVRSAVNVDIDERGQFARRAGSTLALTGDGYDNLFAFDGLLLARHGRSLVAVDPQTLARTVACDLGATAPIDYTEYNGVLYIVSGKGLFLLRPGETTARRAGAFLPSAIPDVALSDVGNFTPGQYTFAISMVDEGGEESPAMILGQLNLVVGARLTGLPILPGRRWRLYMTPPDGDILYLAEEFDAVFAQYTIGGRPDGAPCETLHMRHMPGGQFVRAFAGRIYVASDDTLWFSEPYRPHLTSPRHNFVRFVGKIRFVEFVVGGVYVGDDRGVWWLSGDDPSQYKQQLVSPAVAVPRSSLLLPAHRLAAMGNAPSDADHAVWLSSAGYMVGAPGGQVKALHPERIRLAPDTPGQSVFLLRDGVQQLLTLTATPGVPTVPGRALDTRHH